MHLEADVRGILTWIREKMVAQRESCPAMAANQRRARDAQRSVEEPTRCWG
jgi:hypothetical protein